jgi:hypothetical protein
MSLAPCPSGWGVISLFFIDPIPRALIYAKSGARIYRSGMEYKLHKTSQEKGTGWHEKKHTEEPG